MGFFKKLFEKKECSICGGEIGLLGNRKLEDGNCCKNCAGKLSPWFDDRRHSTVDQIKAQLAYREQNAKEHENFTISRKIGDEEYIMYIEEENGVPTRFFVTCRSDYTSENPDIISFKDVISCVTDIQVQDEEIKRKNAEGQMVSYNPRRYEHHHDFFIKMEIRNNPYFDEINFRINGSCITLETVGDVRGSMGAAALAGVMQSVGISTAGVQTNSLRNSSEHRRYEECRMICQRIEQAVEDGKRGAAAAPVAQSVDLQSILAKIDKINHAPDLLTAVTVGAEVARLITSLSDPDWERVKKLNDEAVAEAKLRFGYQEPSNTPVQEAPKPKFCPGCGAATDGGKFCQFCGTKF